jgi:pimeloyl-ACP methyl ester carboxylesterase
MAERPGRDETITLIDRRALMLRHYGDESGVPVLMLHGTPGSRYKFSSTHEHALKNKLHIIAPDRWDYGGSDAPDTPTLARYADEIADVMARIGIQRFAVAGISGGGPYAAAIASRLPDRVTAAALVSPVGLVSDSIAAGEVDLFHRFCFTTLATSPKLVGAIFATYAAAVRRAPGLACRMTTLRAPSADQAIMRDCETSARLLATFEEGLRRSSRGPAIDLALFRELVSIDLSCATMPSRIWIGLHDTNVPVAAAKRLAAKLPNAQLTELSEDGHLWVAHHYDEILAWIAAASLAGTHAAAPGSSTSAG